MKVLLILVDGMRPDFLAEVPEAQALIAKSASTLEATTVFPSVTLPCHVSLFHSVDPSRHGTTTNTYAPQVRPIKGIAEVLKDAKKKCAIFYNWEQHKDLSRPGSMSFSYFAAGRIYTYEATNHMVTDAAIDHLTKYQPDFAFYYLGWLDEAGHANGWGSDEYKRALHSSWQDITRVLEVLPEDYTVIVTADHGGHDRTHGTEMPEDMTIPIIACGAPFEAGSKLEGLNIKDIAPTIVDLLGVEPAEEWEGKSFVQKK